MLTDGNREPRPRSTYLRSERIVYPVTRAFILPKPRERRVDFFRVLKKRRSAGNLESLTKTQLANFLGHAIMTMQAQMIPDGSLWQHKAAASAGGIHPIDTFVLNFPLHGCENFYYDALGHTLKQLSAQHSAKLRSLYRATLKVKNEPNATCVWFAAQCHLTSAKYHNSESLIWRDSGCLIMTAYLVATALGLKSCALGITGNRYFNGFGSRERQVQGVGGILIGT